MRHLSLAIGLVVVSMATAADPPRDVPVSKLDTESRPIGQFGQPLGKVVTVQGVIVKGFSKSDVGKYLIRVQRINGRATQEHIEIRLEPFGFGLDVPELEFGKTYELKGYETGAFVGIPREVMEIITGGGKTMGIAAPDFHFRNHFEVLQAEKIKPIRLSPADFVDREALFDGRAVSDDKRAYIAGDGWRLLVDANAPWPKDVAGKTVEGHGTIRKTDERITYRLEKGVTRLVRLEDQLGRKVTLRGRAWSWNGHQLLAYRGSGLYVENMKDPSGRTPDYDEPVVVEGVLDEAMLPDLKSEGDLKKYFIVRKPTWKKLDALLSPELER
jgi:hypothetical protein